MRLTSLEVTNVRNLQSVSLNPHSRTNFIVGPNGSGKTSLLESISLLSNGRSFRSADSKKLIAQGSDQLVVFGKVCAESLKESRLGISKDSMGNTNARLDGERLSKVSVLAKMLPSIAIDTSSVDLIEGGPSLRRSMLDWGLFHVEHSYLDAWSQYRAALRQKNALLKSAANVTAHQVNYWNAVLERYGERLDTERMQYVDALIVYTQRIFKHYFGSDVDIQFRYRAGWNRHEYPKFADCLNSKVDSEIERRSCVYGPHRAELDILWGGTLAKDICSRGQKKLVLYGVRLAQISLMLDRTGVSPVLLLDDLPAEMDKKNIENVTQFLTEFPCQTFITAINEQSIDDTLLAGLMDHTMFHVEHGTLR